MARFRIREIMEESKKKGNKITQTTLASKAGVAQSYIWKIINSETTAPDPVILLTIASVLSDALGRKLTIDDLIEQNNNSSPVEAVEKLSLGNPSPAAVEVVSTEIKQDIVYVPIFTHIPKGNPGRMGADEIVGYLPMPKKLWES